MSRCFLTFAPSNNNKYNKMKQLFFSVIAALLVLNLHAQESANLSKNIRQALEVESLFPMFFSGGFHIGMGYRYNDFRVRASVINGGNFDAENSGLRNSSEEFKRYYKTSPGIFIGYNVWKNLELYTYFEYHTFEIEQKSTEMKKDLQSFDFGGGVGYQFFVWKGLYVQPAFHVYLRKDNSLHFNEAIYNIPNVDISPVIRVGYRFWSK